MQAVFVWFFLFHEFIVSFEQTCDRSLQFWRSFASKIYNWLLQYGKTRENRNRSRETKLTTTIHWKENLKTFKSTSNFMEWDHLWVKIWFHNFHIFRYFLVVMYSSCSYKYMIIQPQETIVCEDSTYITLQIYLKTLRGISVWISR